jgi:N4-(beta-N-acetylglucosaminyl)-L-asparaginase
MSSRRDFIKVTALGAAVLPLHQTFGFGKLFESKPIVVSTWTNLKANTAAWAVLSKGGRSLDAVEQGGRVVEADPTDTSVGYGGLPDRDGKVTLDACIMDDQGNCGSVAFVQGFMHPVSIARMVMEKTPHVMLVGQGQKSLLWIMDSKMKIFLPKNLKGFGKSG